MHTIDVYRQRLARLVKHPKMTGLLRWWLTELSSLLPAKWRSSGLDLSDAIVVQFALPGVNVSRVDKGRLVEVGGLDLKSTGPVDQKTAFMSLLNKFPGRSGKVAIALPARSVLVKKMRLPLAVEENLENVLGFEMDRNTPFTSDQVYFDYRILHRDVQNNRMELEIAVAPREEVERSVAQLASWGIMPVAVTIAEPDALNERFNLLPRTSRPHSPSFMGQRNRILLALVFVLATGTLLMPVVIKREAVLRLMPVVDRAKLAAEATDDLHRKLDALTAQHNFLLEKKRESPVLVVLFDELTRKLPDDTWVQQLDLKGKELRIMGETGSASKLIGLMEQSKILYDANFSSPLTKGQSPNSERFQLVANVKPMPINKATIASPQPRPAVKAQKTQNGEAAKTVTDPRPRQTKQEQG
jgi:general secretion pathway protein L